MYLYSTKAGMTNVNCQTVNRRSLLKHKYANWTIWVYFYLDDQFLKKLKKRPVLVFKRFTFIVHFSVPPGGTWSRYMKKKT